jgi:hypothetical protein
MEQYIQIKDSKGILHKWFIEEKTENTYKIFCKGFISEINKRNTYMKDNLLYTSEIRNPFTTMINGKGQRYTKAEYCELWI